MTTSAYDQISSYGGSVDPWTGKVATPNYNMFGDTNITPTPSTDSWFNNLFGTTDPVGKITTPGLGTNLGTLGSGALSLFDAFNKWQTGQANKKYAEAAMQVMKDQTSLSKLTLSDNLNRQYTQSGLNAGLSRDEATSNADTKALSTMSKYGL
jgi:hypothetical protein